MPVKTNEREYRRLDVANLETRAEDDGSMIVEGYATTFSQPYTLFENTEMRLMEQVDPGAFSSCDLSDVIMQYDHQGRVFARTRNGTLQVTPDEHGLRIRADLGGTTLGRQLFEEIRGGYTDRMSFGFTVAPGGESREETRSEDGRKLITRTILAFSKLFDVSAVSLPANDATEISVRSLADGEIAKAEAECLAIARRKTKLRLMRLKMEVNNHEHR